jgi:4-amino-4-deoxy-L-arabinose transferase-like glycosyltransferase
MIADADIARLINVLFFGFFVLAADEILVHSCNGRLPLFSPRIYCLPVLLKPIISAWYVTHSFDVLGLLFVVAAFYALLRALRSSYRPRDIEP